MKDDLMENDRAKPNWFDIEALICFFTYCCACDRGTFEPAYKRVSRLANEVREMGWNEDRIQRCYNLVFLEREISEVYAHIFVEEFLTNGKV